MTPADLARLKALIVKAGILPLRNETTYAGGPDGFVFGSVEDDALAAIVEGMNALPEMIAWASRAREVLERNEWGASIGVDGDPGCIECRQPKGRHLSGCALAALLSDEPGAPEGPLYPVGYQQLPYAEAHAKVMDWLRRFPGIADNDGAERVYEAAEMIGLVEANITVKTTPPWGERFRSHAVKGRPVFDATLKGTKGTITAEGDTAAELGAALLAGARRLLVETPE